MESQGSAKPLCVGSIPTRTSRGKGLCPCGTSPVGRQIPLRRFLALRDLAKLDNSARRLKGSSPSANPWAFFNVRLGRLTKMPRKNKQLFLRPGGGMAYARRLKRCGRKAVWVRPPPRAPPLLIAYNLLQ